MSTSSIVLPRWTLWVPIAAWLIFGAAVVVPGQPVLIALVGAALAGAVFAGVHHAEVVAHKVGEPFGTLVLAIAVTVIEVALIVSVMLTAGPEKAGLARDTVFAAVMLVSNGIVGICLLVGGIRHREQDFRIQGASASLAVLASLSVLTLVMPNYTTTHAGPVLSPAQLAFAGVSSLVLYGVFVFVQTVRHRDYFLADAPGEDAHAAPPSNGVTLTSAIMLLVCLVAVVLLAKLLSPVVEAAVRDAGAPPAVVGIVIAALVLLPEALAAVRAARADRLQTSLNLALGSALASIGLTIPTVAGVFLVTKQPLILGIDGKETVLLFLTLVVGTLTLGTGRTTILQGAVHLSLLAAYLFLSFAP
ncbi:ionic transporter y4hA [Paraburkholderia sp.]|uniref:calcium:proton antiporter n=1 Tax=Paraburkholderia sp. TaxID=1926495 RepID=UPI00238C7A4B|nr:ionic transporter y4hA [Paraburkholderia sp.]MDE1182561.1 ionic transporter y4hA [Paraburkholderia sp.]